MAVDTIKSIPSVLHDLSQEVTDSMANYEKFATIFKSLVNFFWLENDLKTETRRQFCTGKLRQVSGE